MRIFDLLKLAAKTLKGRWAVVPVVGITIGMFCLCFAGAVLTKVQQEKSMPCELNVTSGTSEISDSIVVEISKIPEVSAVTPLLTVPVTVKTGDYSAELTLTGITPAYLNYEFSEGGVFPDSSVMPYIILNEATCKLFNNGDNDSWSEAETLVPDINWLNAEFTLILGESKRQVISKVCGILSGEEEQQPLAYISISCAKDLLQRKNRNADYTGANVRINNIGCSESVTKKIDALGLTVSNSGEELQKEWNTETNEMAYLIVTGIFSLLCAAILMTACRKISLLEKKEEYEALRWIGMKGKEIGRLFVIQSVIISLFGIAVGILMSTSLPSFLSPELQGTSIFTLPVPFGVAALSAAISVAAGMVPFLNIKSISSNYNS